jgi:T5SS/PEP-CTERM-associated repeat protein
MDGQQALSRMGRISAVRLSVAAGKGDVMTDYYLTGQDADKVESYLIADGDDWVTPPSLPGTTDRVMIGGMRSGTLNVAAVLGYSGNFNPAPNVDSPASISGGTVTASSAPLGLLIGNSSGHTHATVTINGPVGGDISVADGDVEAAAVDGNVSAGVDATVTVDSVTGSVSAGGGGKVYVIGDVDASEGSVAASAAAVEVGGNIVTQGFVTGNGGLIDAASIAYGGAATMMNYMDGGQVVTESYNISGHAGSGSRLDILNDARMSVTQNSFGSGRLAGDSDAVYVDGPGSYLGLSGNLAIGVAGQGSFTLSNGGLATGLKNLSLGIEKSGKGFVSVDGEETRLRLDGHLVVGDNGQGSLSFSDGGKIKGMDDLALGVRKSGSGTVSIDGKGSGWNLDFFGNLLAGDQGRGSLSITHGAEVSMLGAILGKQQSGHGNISIATKAELFTGDDLTLGAKGEGMLSMNHGKASLSGLVLGVSASGKGTVDVGFKSELSVQLGDVIIGKNGSGVIAVHHDSSFEGDNVTIGGKGKLTVDNVGEASISRVTTIEENGVLAVRGDNTFANLARADISGRISVSDNGRVEVTKAIVGDGEISIGKDGFLYLNGADHGVDIRFAASSKGAVVALAHANLLDHAIIRGFGKGDEIQLRDLSGTDALISVARRGANTAVTIRDEDGHKAGQLTLAGHYARSDLDFVGGTLTTDGRSRGAAATAHDDFLFANHAADSADAGSDRGKDNTAFYQQLTDSAIGAPVTGYGDSLHFHNPQDVFDFAG